MLQRLQTVITTTLKALAKPAIGMGGAIAAAYVGYIPPDMATGICVGVYTSWITPK